MIVAKIVMRIFELVAGISFRVLELRAAMLRLKPRVTPFCRHGILCAVHPHPIAYLVQFLFHIPTLNLRMGTRN